MTTTEPVSTKV